MGETRNPSRDESEPVVSVPQAEQGTTIKVETYSSGHLPDGKIAEDMSRLFLNNYPDMYTEELRKIDLERYDSSEKIQQQIKDGNIFITAAVEDKMAGMIKFRQESRTDNPDCEEWLVSWLIVDKPYRKLKLGVVDKLIEDFLMVMSERKKASGKRIFMVADVHKDNKGSIYFCKKMGCDEGAGKKKDYLLFRREVN